MKRHQEMISTIIVLGLACAVHPGESRELPEDIQEFAAQQHQEILVQGMEARRAIGYKLRVDSEARRIAFMESQGRSIMEQGEAALASIKDGLRVMPLAGLEAPGPGRLAVDRPPAGHAAMQAAYVAVEGWRAELEEAMAWARPVEPGSAFGPVPAAGLPDQER